MRIPRPLLACLLIVACSSVCARGGPGGALGGALEGLAILAIVGGLIAGAACGRALSSVPVVRLIFFTLIFVAVSLAIPVLGMFLLLLCIPWAIFAAVFVSAFDMMRLYLSRAPQAAPSPSSVGIQHPPVVVRVARYCARWIAGTYVFWTIVSLANFEFLAFLAMPPVLFVFPQTIGKFLPFILPPLAVAIGTGIIVTLLYSFVRKRSSPNPYLAPLVFNVCVLVVFLTSAEIYSRHLMDEAMVGHTPNHLERSSFLDSVLSHTAYWRSPHASFDEAGKTYRWSYSKRTFFQVP